LRDNPLHLLSRLQRRHRIWIALSALAGLLLAAGTDRPGPALLGIAVVVLAYALPIRQSRNAARVLLGIGTVLAISSLIIGTLAAGFSGSMPDSAAALRFTVPAILLIGAASSAVLVHFAHIPDRRIRASVLLAALWLAGTIALLVVSAPILASIGAWTGLAVGLALVEHNWRNWLGEGRPGPRAKRCQSLSVMIVCKNEADRIETCLRQVSGWADELVVIDSGSTDGTVEIARRYSDRVWSMDWAGFSRQKQRALERCTGDWVLNIDADEYVSDDLKCEIDAWLAQPIRFRAFRICWVSMVFGKAVYFGADGRYHKRLFLRQGARFNEADVHEDIIVDGPVARLGAPVLHDTFRDYEHLKQKFTRYALISAQRIRNRHRHTGPVLAWLRAAAAFVLLYLRRLGILDGRRGLLMATIYAVYTFDKYAAAWAARASPDQS
jgi:hypothetical protein